MKKTDKIVLTNLRRNMKMDILSPKTTELLCELERQEAVEEFIQNRISVYKNLISQDHKDLYLPDEVEFLEYILAECTDKKV